MAHEEKETFLLVAVPEEARNGRWIADQCWRCSLIPGAVIFPPEPPVAAMDPAERPADVKGAPGFGAAKRTLDGEDRSGMA